MLLETLRGQLEQLFGFRARPNNTLPLVLSQSAIPFILCGGTAGAGTDQFTMGNNGALSTLANTGVTYDAGAWMYMPANAIFAGSVAGWYWYLASSPTAGTLFDNRYISGDPKLAVPANPTPFVSTGPGLVTQTINTYIDCMQITIPGGSIGPNGSLRTTWAIGWSIAGTGGNYHLWLGSAKYLDSQSLAANPPSRGAHSGTVSIRNQGSQSRQVSTFGPEAAYTNTTGLNGYSLPTHSDTIWKASLRINTAASSHALFGGYTLELLYGA